jgi:desampylase
VKRGFTGTADVPPAHDLSGNAAADKMSAVPVKPCSLVINQALRDQLIAEARAAYPRECCGLIEGVRTTDAIEARALHPTRNLAESANRFEIDPAEHIRLLRSLRGTGREIVGCYHSHPDGAPEPSPRDREMAGEDGFVWLIASVGSEGLSRIAAHLFSDGAFRPLPLA